MKNVISQVLMYLGGFSAFGGFMVMFIQTQLNVGSYKLIQQGLTPVSLPMSVVWTGYGVMMTGMVVLAVGLLLWPHKTEI